MAAITATSTITEGASVLKFSGAPQSILLTAVDASDTYVHPVGVSAWAITDTTTGAFNVSYAPSTRTFTIVQVGGGTFKLLIWPAK